MRTARRRRRHLHAAGRRQQHRRRRRRGPEIGGSRCVGRGRGGRRSGRGRPGLDRRAAVRADGRDLRHGRRVQVAAAQPHLVRADHVRAHDQPADPRLGERRLRRAAAALLRVGGAEEPVAGRRAGRPRGTALGGHAADDGDGRPVAAAGQHSGGDVQPGGRADGAAGHGEGVAGRAECGLEQAVVLCE